MVLDVAAGPGESVLGASRQLEREGVRVRVTLTDRSASHLPHNGVPMVVGDALRLPFADASFDVVTSSLFVHHLEPKEIVKYVDETLRVCRVATVINDLQRSSAHWALTLAGRAIYHSRITRHDAPASVRRAYTSAEFSDIMARSKAAEVEISRHFLYRVGIIGWKRAHA
jgi:ubiquinone/menaquinone biosynthesis C-methylase UbiE